VKCSALYKGRCLKLTICVCYSWEMALVEGLDMSFDDVRNQGGIRERAGEDNSTKV
jgi:hypothetical protein